MAFRETAVSHAETLRLLRDRGLCGLRVRCVGDPALAVLDTGPAGAYDLAVVAVGRDGLAEATKSARALVESLAPGGVVVTSVAWPGGGVSVLSAYSGRPEEAAYAGDPRLGPADAEALAAHAGEYAGLGCRVQVVHLGEVTLVVATRLTE